MAKNSTKNYAARMAQSIEIPKRTNPPPKVPQSVQTPLKGRETEVVKNTGGGYSFQINKWDMLDRFLILGTEGGRCNLSEIKLTSLNFTNINACLKEDFERTINRAVEVSHKGLAAKNDMALAVLAYAAANKDNVACRKLALSSLAKVARTATHLFSFIEMARARRGGGRLLKKAIQDWYVQRDADSIAYQIAKYPSRNGWSHRDVLRLFRPIPPTTQHNAAFRYAVKGEVGTRAPSIIIASDMAKKNVLNHDFLINKLIGEQGLTFEMLPTECLTNPDIWRAMLKAGTVGITALIRNLARLTVIGLIKPLSAETQVICSMLTDKTLIQRGRLHPLSIILAYDTYGAGRGVKGTMTWTPVRQILDALEKAFYLSFEYAKPTGLNHMVSVDVSGSMFTNKVPGTHLSCGKAAATLSMLVARTEKNHWITGFGTTFVDLGINASDSLDTVMQKSSRSFGSTNCAAPIVYATKNNLEVDMFTIITDNDANSGPYAHQELVKYRKKTGRNAKMAVVSLYASYSSIADPTDSGMMDFVGFSADLPKMLSIFATGSSETFDEQEGQVEE